MTDTDVIPRSVFRQLAALFAMHALIGADYTDTDETIGHIARRHADELTGKVFDDDK